ncbi:MAG TPA: hypothetical protein VE868_07675, partial [Balneolaceae bacterium]|nr:hypothetical protein [Balneolaceae bacterium]
MDKLVLWICFLVLIIGPPVDAAIGQNTDSVSADRQALMDLYKATNGSGWSHHSGWGTGEPMGSWYGIKTNSRGRV